MSAKSKIQQIIETEIQPRSVALEKASADQKPKIEDLANKLAGAIKAKNQALIKRHLSALEVFRMGPYASLKAGAKELVGQLAKLKPADETGDDYKKITALTTSLGILQGKLDRNYEKLKQIEDLANDELERFVAEGGNAREEWAEMEGWLKAQLEAGKLHLQAMETLDDLANKAMAAGDQADLDYAIKKSEERSKWKPTQKEVQEKFSKFCVKCEASGLSQDLVDQLTRDRVAFKKIVDELADLNKKMDEIQNRVENAYISTVDVKAIARSLKLTDAKAIERLKRALKPVGDERVRALKALQIDFKLKFSPKDMDMLMKVKTR
jgi:hypothetical protein